MKINVLDKVLNYDGTPVPNIEIEITEKGQEIKQRTHLTWRQVIYTTLNNPPLEGERPLTPEEKVTAYQITTKAYESDTPDLNVEERAFLLKNIERIGNALVTGRSKEVFEDKVAKEAKKKA